MATKKTKKPVNYADFQQSGSSSITEEEIVSALKRVGKPVKLGSGTYPFIDYQTCAIECGLASDKAEYQLTQTKCRGSIRKAWKKSMAESGRLAGLSNRSTGVYLVK